MDPWQALTMDAHLAVWLCAGRVRLMGRQQPAGDGGRPARRDDGRQADGTRVVGIGSMLDLKRVLKGS